MFLPVNAVINFDTVNTFQNSSTFIVRVGLNSSKFMQSNSNNGCRRLLESIYSVKIDNSINRKDRLPNEYIPLLKDNN